MLGALIAGKRSEREILGSGGVLGELTRRLVERALQEELSDLVPWVTPRPARRAVD